MAQNKRRKPKPVVEALQQTELARVMSGGGAVPGWKKFLERKSREEREEELKYTGGPTGEKLQN